MLNRVNVDFQKQTVDPVRVSFNTSHGTQMVSELLLTIDVTEVRISRAAPSPESRVVTGCTWPSARELTAVCLLVI